MEVQDPLAGKGQARPSYNLLAIFRELEPNLQYQSLESSKPSRYRALTIPHQQGGRCYCRMSTPTATRPHGHGLDKYVSVHTVRQAKRPTGPRGAAQARYRFHYTTQRQVVHTRGACYVCVMCEQRDIHSTPKCTVKTCASSARPRRL